MPLSIGVNLRVTGHCNQGGRKYMEDMFCVAFQPTPDDKDLEYAFFGIFDGHGGGEAATFAKEHLMDIIVKQKNFWSDRDEDVLRAIRDGYMNTHYAMWRELDKWPRTASGLPSTAGTTASIAFIRKGKIYIGHVGDSAIILGYQAEGDPQWKAKALTKDHKPESGPEMTRIQESGGKVVSKSGVPRVVWNRPRIGHKGPVRRSTHMDEIPFLAVARSLGDLWSYNSELNTFVVSPEPDVKVIPVDVKSHRCLIFGTDGLWNMLSPQSAVGIVQTTDRHNEKHLIASQQTGGTDLQMWINPSKSLVDRALERWSSTRLRADNTSVVTLMLDPSGPCRSEVLFNQKKDRVIHHGTHTPVTTKEPENVEEISPKVPSSCMPIPPPSAMSIELDLKQPDSSNGNEEAVDHTSQPEMVSCPENSILSEIDTTSELQESAIDKSVEAADTGESIQVAEISSSQMPEEPGDPESKKAAETNHEKLEHLEKENKEVAEQNENEEKAKSDQAQTPIQSNPKSNKFVVEPKEIVTETGVFNLTRQNAFSGANEEALQPAPLVSSRLRRSGIVSVKTNSFDGDEAVKNGVLNGSRHKQHPLFPARGPDVGTIKRRHSLSSSQAQNAFADVTPTAPPDSKTYVSVKSRYSRMTKPSVAGGAAMVEETTKGPSKTAGDCPMSNNKRRHSAITQASVSSIGVENGGCAQQEPCAKRRTRSEDQRHSPTDENDPANQAMENANARLSWPASDRRSDSSLNGATLTTLSSSSNTFQRRSLGKKATPVKAIRRSSINGSTRLQHLRGSFGLRDWDQGRNNRASSCNSRRTLNRTVTIVGPTDSTIPQRWLRSDTMAATPVKTLRSRNVDIAGHTISAQLVHQYGVVKQNRLPLPNKLKQSASGGALQSSRVRSSSLSASKLKQANGNGGSVSTCATINPSAAGSTSGIAKKVKSPYNPSARSLSTRSRIKRLGK
ncbi:PREDICTED: protein phosphatase 1D isoform X2 [Wasmannia auropunctata]|uniref:protein phosphatase 1D isoform X2 n=1 Tax=Wasmannia auropunctata TaxID=64793 RepID=UPI0005F05273|nr:PREDICTED: protein phosphatase 1D isoform X2 [Wasmannia auropunctata]